jgi:hypothetical protein
MANVKISQLPGAGSALGTQEFEVNESGLSKKVTGSQLSNYVRGQVLLGDLGITATASEINKLDGVTASTAELNLLDGVTASTAELNILDGVTATTAEINVLDGVTATTAELNLLDGATIALADITATATELNYVDGVTSSIQTQLDAKYVAATQDTATWEAGLGTTESLVSPAKVKAAIEANAPGTTWLSPQTTTSGTSFLFDGIPSGVNNIYIGFDGVSFSNTTSISVKLGTSAGIENSGYFSMSEWSGNVTSSGGGYFVIRVASLTYVASGLMILSRMDASANTWVSSGNILVGTTSTAHTSTANGSKSLSGEVSQVVIGRTGATGTFDAGVVAVGYSK